MNENPSLSTRDRVLELIKKQGPVSVKALTSAVGITPMAIRGHLSKLEKDSLIEVDTIRQKLGRPLQVFTLTEKGEGCFPKHYDRFATDLLTDLEALDNGKTLKKLSIKREERIIIELEKLMGPEMDPIKRLHIYCSYVEEIGNMPNLTEIEPKLFQLSIANCSISAVAQENTFCCDSEIKILKSLFPNSNIQRTQSLTQQAKGCCYQFDFRT